MPDPPAENGAARRPPVWALLCSLARLWRVHLALMVLALLWPKALDD